VKTPFHFRSSIFVPIDQCFQFGLGTSTGFLMVILFMSQA
jgi:hypothetical protein